MKKITLSLIFLFALSVTTIAFAEEATRLNEKAGKQPSPMDFLPMTPIVPDKAQAEQPKPASSESMSPKPKMTPTISKTEVIVNQRENFTGEYKNKFGNLVFIEIIDKNRNETTVQGASFSISSSVGMGGQKADNQCEIGNTKKPKFAKKIDANRFTFYEDYDDERCVIVFNFSKPGSVTISQKGCQSACSFGIADFDGTYRLAK